MACCCKYCSLANKQDGNYLTVAQFLSEKKSLRREMAHLRVNDIAAIELIEELQHRVKQLQDRVIEILGWLNNSTYDRANFVSPSTTNPKKLPDQITQKFTPFDLYRRYLVGDYENDPTDRGFQLDEDILGKVNVKPPEMLDYLDSPQAEDNHETDRPKERIWVKEMFMGIGSESGTLQSELSEYYAMLEDAEYRDIAIEMLKKLFTQGVLDTSDATSDTEEGD